MRGFKVSGWIRSHHVKWDMFWFRWKILPLRCELQSEMKRADLSTVPRSYLTTYTHFIVVKLHFSKLFKFLLLQWLNHSIYRIPLCVFVWLVAAIVLTSMFKAMIRIAHKYSSLEYLHKERFQLAKQLEVNLSSSGHSYPVLSMTRKMIQVVLL